MSNTANSGGGVCNGGTLIMSTSNFTANVAFPASGGGIQTNGVLTFSNGAFYANSAATLGGALWIEAGSANISGSQFRNNMAATNGGALYNSAAAQLSSSAFTSNHAQNGGAIANARLLIVTNSDLRANSAANGAGIQNSNTGAVGVGAVTFESGFVTERRPKLLAAMPERVGHQAQERLLRERCEGGPRPRAERHDRGIDARRRAKCTRRDAAHDDRAADRRSRSAPRSPCRRRSSRACTCPPPRPPIAWQERTWGLLTTRAPMSLQQRPETEP